MAEYAVLAKTNHLAVTVADSYEAAIGIRDAALPGRPVEKAITDSRGVIVTTVIQWRDIPEWTAVIKERNRYGG